MSSEEFKKFSVLSVASFFMMGAQWPLKILKDGLLVGEVGAEYQPTMRLFSILACLAISVIYGQLVNSFRREVVMYSISGFLAIVGVGFYIALSLYPTGILPISNLVLVSAFYLYADSFTVLTIPTFWSFVNDVTNPEEAKKGYSLIVFAAQLGALLTTIAGGMLTSESSNNPLIALSSSFLITIFGFLIFYLVKSVKKQTLAGYDADHHKVAEKHKIPFMKGLALLMTSPYVASILFITASQEILTAVMNFKMLKAVGFAYGNDLGKINAYLFNYAFWINVISCTFSFFGGFFQNVLGISKCVIIYPVALAICFIAVAIHPTLFVVTTAMIIIKGLHYGLNKPSREALYIPTTKEVKYKSKAWIEVFGSRFFKTSGSLINKLPLIWSNSVTVFVSIAWIFFAGYVGNKYNKSVENGETIV